MGEDMFENTTDNLSDCERESNEYLAGDDSKLASFSLTQTLNNYINQTVQASFAAVNTLRPILEGIGKAVITFSQLTEAMRPMLEEMQRIGAMVAKAVSSINLPEYTEEQKQAILESYRQWGRYGWTVLPATPIKFYYTKPLDLNEANQKIKPYCTKQEMESVFADIRKFKLRHDDFESAVFCFDNRQYKACALLLFGLIDAKLIRNQTESNRFVGLKAVGRFKSSLEASENMEMFFTALCCANLVAFLETVFASGNNFKNEPQIINRNFLDHGMTSRSVRRRDCIQLFFALENLLYLTQ